MEKDANESMKILEYGGDGFEMDRVSHGISSGFFSKV